MLIELDDLQVKKERSRKKPNGEDESLFIKNLDNVQGDERDIIIFSISYGKTANGKFSNQFGNLNKDGGEKRMNVAISRAKEKIYVFKSIPSGQINRDLGDGKKGVRIFHDYLEYVEQLEKTKDINSPEIKEIFDRYLKNPND
jgi:superfamily I DNA and/or RNA helicase